VRPILTRSFAAVLLAGALLTVACSSDEPEAAGNVTARRSAARLPEKILGLEVHEEKIGQNITDVQRTYLRSIGLFSFREGEELLRATLQVSEFNDVAPNERERFRDSVIGQLGTSVPVELRVGDDKLFLAAGGEQSIYAWFDELGFYALSVRSDYPFPRTMVRKLLNMEILS
jgi:hypothetical protein